MKRAIYTLILISLVYLTSCTKNTVAPDGKSAPNGNDQAVTSTSSLTNGNTTVPDTAMNITGYVKLSLSNGSSGNNDIVVYFTPKSKPTYVPGEDAPYLPGFGLANFSSTSSDNIALAVNVLPLNSKGDTVRLNVTAKNDGIYSLNLSAINDIPEKFNVWLMDTYQKDSLDMRQNKSYSFNISTADTSSFGKNRFKLVLH
jgi:hypothetical protein